MDFLPRAVRSHPSDSCGALRTRCGFPRQGKLQFYLAFTEGSYQQLFTGANTQGQAVPGSIQSLPHIFQGSQAWQVVFNLVPINPAAALAPHSHYCKALGTASGEACTGTQELGTGRTLLTDSESNSPWWQQQTSSSGRKALGVTHSKSHLSHRYKTEIQACFLSLAEQPKSQ